MNEQEIIKLWKSGALDELPGINFKKVTRRIKSWQRQLRRKTELDVLAGTIMTIGVLIFSIFDPRGFLFLPILVVGHIWYFRSLWAINKHDSEAGKGENTREFLETKAKMLSGFIRKNRIFGATVTPFVIVFSLLLSPEYQTMFTDLRIGLIAMAVTVVMTGIAVLLIEVSLRIMYVPSLDALKELLEQLEEA